MDRYTPDTLICDVLRSHPHAASVFETHGLACPVCMGAEMDTLASVAAMHDIPVDVILHDLNALVSGDSEVD